MAIVSVEYKGISVVHRITNLPSSSVRCTYVRIVSEPAAAMATVVDGRTAGLVQHNTSQCITSSIIEGNPTSSTNA